MSKKCLECGNSFIPQNKRGPKPKYCSYKCKGAHSRKTLIDKNCLNCGKQLRRGQKVFCSYRCYYENKAAEVKQCEICGKEFKGQKRVCSLECAGSISKICEHCGDNYSPNPNHWTTQRFCSDPCQRAWWSENQEKAGKKFAFVCKNCGKEYQTRHSDRNQYCSRECAFEDSKSWVKPYKPPKKEITCKSCGIDYEGYKSGKGYCSDKCRERGSKLICEWCEKTFYHQFSSGVMYCSNDCQYEANLQMARDQYEPKPLFIAECKVCGNEYETNRPQLKCCSEECSLYLFQQRKAEARHRRRARKQGAVVKSADQAEIFERDGWVCQICGKKVNHALRHPHPFSPSLDHVLPLANGGAHEPRNLQLAHLICNSRKSNVQPAQLRLI